MHSTLKTHILMIFISLILASGWFAFNAWGQGQIQFSRFHQLISQYGAGRVSVSRDWEAMLTQLSQASDLEKITQINRFFHRHLRYSLDSDLWKKEDYWATPLETIGKGLGDCEDYAIAKYVSLRQAGIGDDKLRLIYVKARIGGSRSQLTEAHMVLGYYASPTAEPLILDSLVPDVLPASQRSDLAPVFSFNSQGLWAGNTRAASSPTARLSRWRSVLERLGQEGIVLQ